MPPMKIQFNPITQAVNNSISSVGTNTTTTPLATARKYLEIKLRFKDESVDDKRIRTHAYTDRNIVDRPEDTKNKWNNSFVDIEDKLINKNKTNMV